MDSFFVSAPGKVILFGEHAVVHEKAAVATSVSLRSYLLVQVTPVTDGSTPHVTLNFPDIGLSHSWSLSELPLLAEPPSVAPTSLDSSLLRSFEPLLEPFAKKEVQHTAAFAFLYLYLSLSKPSKANVSFLLRSAIPIGSGLGSSASISVCLATALLIIGKRIPPPNYAHDDDDVNVLQTINSWAFLGERCIHGNPSGVDNTVATFGGGVVYRKERQERRLSNGTFTPSKPAEKSIIKIPTLRFLLTDTNHPRRTAILVAHVAELLITLPGVTPYILTAIDGIAAEAKRLLESNERIIERLGELISINQGLLNSVGVGHEKLDTVARFTKEIGWTKLTGAGGGGCALTLLREDVDAEKVKDVEEKLKEQGFKPFEVELGGRGVGILEEFNQELVEEFQHSLGSFEKEEKPWLYWR